MLPYYVDTVPDYRLGADDTMVYSAIGPNADSRIEICMPVAVFEQAVASAVRVLRDRDRRRRRRAAVLPFPVR